MRIGDFCFTPEAGSLVSSDGRRIDLRPQAMDVLRLLAEAEGAVVSKDEILSAVWPDIATGEESLYQCISDIRRALDDAQRTILRTVPRKGYHLALPGARPVPGPRPPTPEPIRFAQSADARLAWTAIGQGTPILKAPSWISNIESEATSLIFGPFYARLAERARIVYFDQRGSSHSSRRVTDWSVDAMVDDMARIADTAGLDRFFLFGPSQGGAFALAFAARFPERVLGIIARGAFATGWKVHGDEVQRRRYEVSKAMISAGWNEPNPEYRRFFTGLLIPDAPPEMAREMDAIQARAVEADVQLANVELQSSLDVHHLLDAVTCPVLLLHSSGDLAVPAERAVELASALPSCELRLLDGNNHIPVPGTAGFEQFMDAIDDFLDRHGSVARIP
ncbi:alpha/beta fold hydrolase [Jannaschia seohaensis]|uniref:Transcriptional regulator n=1 Tax=Jannaschia seohaensis TaxID=475081 RepID=A0A2Y9C3N4_9RHOB|nr:alpha/beta fold hydrolase [Jannaschia seohaensis]PWJ10038.1 transcriptional regulator [Jannaschia seohaensis]SSA51782.1 Transcriptional regulatory protein, C terminal [Jannaschia seohaensis]